jgi:secondary thiamine-phosphate synthase enzyme
MTCLRTFLAATLLFPFATSFSPHSSSRNSITASSSSSSNDYFNKNKRTSVVAASSSSSSRSALSSITDTVGIGEPICEYHQVDIPTSSQKGGPPRQAISVEDLTPTLVSILQESGMKQGVITILSRHTTTAITINERESRLATDMADYFLQLAPPDERSEAAASSASASASASTSSSSKQQNKTAGRRYAHNDIDQRPDSEDERQRCKENGWDIDDPARLQAWRDQEPINAHSHLLSMLLGSSESIPVVDGKMMIGQWQSVLLVDLDGPRDRTVGVQCMGYQ